MTRVVNNFSFECLRDLQWNQERGDMISFGSEHVKGPSYSSKKAAGHNDERSIMIRDEEAQTSVCIGDRASPVILKY